MKNLLNQKFTLYYLPIIALAWYIFEVYLNGPFYFSRIDPEYPYLLNGLNCAVLDFHLIGHVDHPGTPFQMLTGLFIRIIHLVAGRNEIIDDIITRPEFYLLRLNLILSLLTVSVLAWLGGLFLTYKQDQSGAWIVQSTVFISAILLEVSHRYIPDRFQVLLVLILVGLILKKYLSEKYTEKKFAIHTGILLGIGFVTKFNFFPLLIIPLIIITQKKNRLWYGGSVVLSIIINFLPIHIKFNAYKRFILSILKHDSLYGQGQARLINPENFFHSLAEMLRVNITFTLILILSLGVLLYSLQKAFRQKYPAEIRILLAIVLASLLSLFIIAKHYKNYYVLPMVTLGGLALYFDLIILKNYIRPQLFKVSLILLLSLFFILPWKLMARHLSFTAKYNTQSTLVAEYIQQNINREDYIFIEPTWLSGAFPENGLVYGFSFVASLNQYYNVVEKYYSNILTWEGADKPMRFFRMIDADNELILKSGRNILVYSTPLRNANLLSQYVLSEAEKYTIQLQCDTLISNESRSEYIIRFAHTDSWFTKNRFQCGFENVANDTLWTDNGELALAGSFELSAISCNGFNAIKLSPEQNLAPALKLQNLQAGDYIEFSLKWYSIVNNEHDYLELVLTDSSGVSLDSLPALTNYISREISPGWRLKRVCFTVPSGIPDRCYARFRYSGNAEIILDDYNYVQCSLGKAN